MAVCVPLDRPDRRAAFFLGGLILGLIAAIVAWLLTHQPHQRRPTPA